ncbi:hypothetical protein [Cohnella luojiensis]|uniref:Uncharacterized protein n=1 Tax=Cohnella luojiensis TaxID=652876 RepID=A0A4Y8LYF9_9BACL|nr:hypothetical protein [Cohnella luojiensis]TFE24401.1 hypothetical protein E2980_16260 [Cohnella luojiensis]
MSPWLAVVLLGVAITGYAWLMPKTNARDKEKEFESEAAYTQLLEDLETENRELFDAVAKFKREQDETVDKLGRRIVDMEQQMKMWTEQAVSVSVPTEIQSGLQAPAVEALSQSPLPYVAVSLETEAAEMGNDLVAGEIDVPPTTIRGRYPELLEMHDKGRSVEQIAKAMGMNKGEVQLILQLVRREEQQHA